MTIPSPAHFARFIALCLVFTRTGALDVEIDLHVSISTTNNDYVCATMDWWPAGKQDYGNFSWGNAGAFNQDLSDPKLLSAMTALKPTLRVGGTLADFVVYDTGNPPYCVPQVTTGSGKWDFRGGCLSMARWQALNDFCAASGCQLVFALSGLFGRDTDSAAWDPSNAEALLRYTTNMPNATLAGVELGNELTGPHGILAHLAVDQVAADFVTMRGVLNRVFPDAASRPALIGPDAVDDTEWLAAWAAAVPPGTVDAVSWHIYLTAGVDLALLDKITTPKFLYERGFTRARAIRDAVFPAAGDVELWMGEGGGAYNSGQNTTTNAFASGFWYLDQLGSYAQLRNAKHCRQTFCGGNYGLLDVDTHEPNPDFYNALAFKTLMGPRVLNATTPGFPADYLRVYAHCAPAGSGAISILAINYDRKAAVNVTLPADIKLYPREEYRFTAPGGDLRSRSTLLNGRPLQTGPNGEIPDLNPEHIAQDAPITLDTASYAFFVFPNVGVPACM